WSCHSGSCKQNRNGKVGGDLIDLVALVQSSSTLEAAQRLAEIAGVDAKPDKPIPPSKPDSTVSEYEPITWTYKSESLNPDHEYIRRRGIKPETARHFGIAAYTGTGPTMRGRLIIPIHDDTGKLWGYAGR